MANINKSLSIIVPVYMEAGNIRGTIKNIIWAVNAVGLTDYEILIIDCKKKDGEDDGTPGIAEELSKANHHIRAIHNPYMSLPNKYWQGVFLAKCEYVTWIPGDDVIFPESIKEIFQATGKADVVCCYTMNPEVRPLQRRIISKIFTIFVNLLFGMHLRYFNSITVCKAELLLSLPESAKKNEGFTFNAEILIRLIKSGYNFVEVPHRIKPDPQKAGSSGLKNFWLRYTPLNIMKALFKLFWEIRIKNKFLTG
jgi:glycosyltransferase involved in cell wall biosynthesis